jgi:hypothetical protein
MVDPRFPEADCPKMVEIISSLLDDFINTLLTVLSNVNPKLELEVNFFPLSRRPESSSSGEGERRLKRDRILFEYPNHCSPSGKPFPPGIFALENTQSEKKVAWGYWKSPVCIKVKSEDWILQS